jgi:hypothetical protein
MLRLTSNKLLRRPGAVPIRRCVRHLLRAGIAVVLMAATTATGAAAATYNGPFGTQVDIGQATCWTHNDFVWASSVYDNGTVLSKDLVIEGPAVRMGPMSSFTAFTNVKWTVTWFSLAQGATTWTHEADLSSWGTHTAAMSTTWTFGISRISINPRFRGQVRIFERLDFVDAHGRTVPGGAFVSPEPSYTTHVYSYSPSVDVFANGACLF